MAARKTFASSKFKDFEWTDDELSVFMGGMLGDSGMQKRGNSYRYYFGQCDAQGDYCK